jgi:RNA polymerase sigma factor (sigma-70 family)
MDLELFQRYKDGDPKALDLLVQSEGYLVRDFVLYHYRGWSDQEDLVQAGMMGLTQAITTWDPAKIKTRSIQASWKLYAVRGIRNHVQLAVPKVFVISRPRSTQVPMSVQRTEEAFVAQYGVNPPGASAENYTAIDVSGVGVEEIGESEPLEEYLDLKHALDKLKPRQKRILTRTYIEGCTYEEVSFEEGITKQRARQIAIEAIKDLGLLLKRPCLHIN